MITAEHILKYVKQGFSVFPVILRQSDGHWEKKPAIDSWREYMDRLPTEQEIETWCALADFNALGMATGKLSGVVVLDLDDPSLITEYASTTRVKTISGGYHLWYKYRDGIRNTVRINGRALDVRGDGGFVVVPPSGEGEHKYVFESFSKDLPPFPDIVEEKKQYQPLETLPTAGKGERNQTAIRVAGHIISNTREKAWETTAWPAFVKWNETMVTPPLSEYELRTTFDSACQMESRNHAHVESAVKVYWGKNLTQAYDQMKSQWGDGLTTSYYLLDEYFTFYPEQIYLISAQTFIGKTTLSLNIAAKVASLGKKVLFCSLEQGIFIEPKVRSLLGGEVPPTFGILDSDSFLTVDELVTQVQSIGALDLLVIDHLHFFKKELKQGTTGAMDDIIHRVQLLARKLHIPVIVMAHLRKLNDKKQPDMDDLRDSSALSQVPSVVIQLTRESNEATGELLPEGKLFIRKNRIKGTTGSLFFTINSNSDVELSLPTHEYARLMS